jgi:hypothetical protein
MIVSNKCRRYKIHKLYRPHSLGAIKDFVGSKCRRYILFFKSGNPISSLCLRYPSAHNLAKVLTLKIYPTRSVTLIAPLASRRLKVWEVFKQ